MRCLPALLLALAISLSITRARAQNAPFEVAVVGFAQNGATPVTGAYLVLEIQFERFLMPSVKDRRSSGLREGAKLPPPPEAAPSPTVSVPLARQAVLRAWVAAGLAGDDQLDGMARRARWSALLPEVRFRMLRSDRQTDVTGGDGVRTDGTYGATEWYEVRVGLHLDRLVFADEELAIERIRVDREHEREQLAGKVVAELGRFARARLDEADPGEDDHAHLEALVRELESAMMLDVLTGGWFSGWLSGGK
ncbi:hypothetical protein BH09MYX1_BH09MYX1_56940 [soil metagenome]